MARPIPLLPAHLLPALRTLHAHLAFAPPEAARAFGGELEGLIDTGILTVSATEIDGLVHLGAAGLRALGLNPHKGPRIPTLVDHTYARHCLMQLKWRVLRPPSHALGRTGTAGLYWLACTARGDEVLVMGKATAGGYGAQMVRRQLPKMGTTLRLDGRQLVILHPTGRGFSQLVREHDGRVRVIRMAISTDETRALDAAAPPSNLPAHLTRALRTDRVLTAGQLRTYYGATPEQLASLPTVRRTVQPSHTRADTVTATFHSLDVPGLRTWTAGQLMHLAAVAEMRHQLEASLHVERWRSDAAGHHTDEQPDATCRTPDGRRVAIEFDRGTYHSTKIGAKLISYAEAGYDLVWWGVMGERRAQHLRQQIYGIMYHDRANSVIPAHYKAKVMVLDWLADHP